MSFEDDIAAFADIGGGGGGGFDIPFDDIAAFADIGGGFNIPFDDIAAFADIGGGGFDIPFDDIAAFADLGYQPEGVDIAAMADLGLTPEGLLDRSDIFNAARDSQLFNETRSLEDALAGYQDPGATPSGVYIDNWRMGMPDSVFNAAKDSQLANEMIERRAAGFEHIGDNALAGYQAPGATPSQVRINGGQYGPDIKGSDGKTYRVGTDGKTVIDKETDKPVTNTNTIKEILQKYFTTTGSQPQQQPNLLSSLLPLLLMMMAMNRGSGGSSTPTGTIPALGAAQSQTPYSQIQQAPGYRPGQGGITYFNPVQYMPKMADGGIVSLAKQDPRGLSGMGKALRARHEERKAAREAERALRMQQMAEQRAQRDLQIEDFKQRMANKGANRMPAAPVAAPVAAPAAPVDSSVTAPVATPAAPMAPTLPAFQQTNYTQQMAAPGYRPGQGGISYFSQMPIGTPANAPGMAGGGIIDLAKALAAKRREQRLGLLKGRGDGVSDSIPAMIGKDQPARLARGEYVVDARTVAELGNGSTDAGAERLDEMRKRVHAKRKKAKVGQDSKAHKALPA